MAVCTAAVAERGPAALKLAELLLAAGADVMQRCAGGGAGRGGGLRSCAPRGTAWGGGRQAVGAARTARRTTPRRHPRPNPITPPPLPPARSDDMDRTALHWAAEVGLDAAIPPLLAAGEAAVEVLRRQHEEDAAAAAAALADASDGGGGVLPELPPPPALGDVPDANGDVPLHLAARAGRAGAVAALLARAGGWDGTSAAGARNKAKDTPLHAAARAGAGAAAAALLAAAPDAAGAANKHGLTPAELAARRGHAALAATLRGGRGGAPNGAAAAAAGATLAPDPERLAAPGRVKTLLLAPPECLEHFTSPQPVVRGAPEPPPENLERIQVLVAPGRGCLRAAEFDGRVEWGGRLRPAPMGDLLRVHDWAYLRTLQARGGAGGGGGEGGSAGRGPLLGFCCGVCWGFGPAGVWCGRPPPCAAPRAPIHTARAPPRAGRVRVHPRRPRGHRAP